MSAAAAGGYGDPAAKCALRGEAAALALDMLREVGLRQNGGGQVTAEGATALQGTDRLGDSASVTLPASMLCAPRPPQAPKPQSTPQQRQQLRERRKQQPTPPPLLHEQQAQLAQGQQQQQEGVNEGKF